MSSIWSQQEEDENFELSDAEEGSDFSESDDDFRYNLYPLFLDFFNCFCTGKREMDKFLLILLSCSFNFVAILTYIT